MKLTEHDPHTPEDFDLALDRTLAERGEAEPAPGYGQRLGAYLEQANGAELPGAAVTAAPAQPLLTMAGGIQTQRSPASFWTAVVAHAVIIALIAWMVARHISVAAPVPQQVATVIAPPLPPPTPPVMPKAEKMGGGGGQHDLAPVTSPPIISRSTWH